MKVGYRMKRNITSIFSLFFFNIYRSEGTQDDGMCSHHHAPDPCHFEYHAAQLEKFLTEYRCLQEQLIHMKQSYEAHKRAGSIPRYF